MNKVILMGRLTRDPEVRYTQSAEPLAIARYTLAVNRKFKREGEPDADFINCTAIGRGGSFAEKFLKKGMMVAVSGRLQIRSYDDKNGTRQWFTEVVVEDQDFAESKAAFESRSSAEGMGGGKPDSQNAGGQGQAPDGFYSIDEGLDDEDLPF